MQSEEKRIESRLKQILPRLESGIYRNVSAITIDHWNCPGEPIPFQEAKTAPYVPYSIGSLWGKRWSTTWFRIRFRVEDHGFYDNGVVRIAFDYDAIEGFTREALVYYEGVPLLAINCNRSEIPLSLLYRKNKYDYELFLEAAANPKGIEVESELSGVTLDPDFGVPNEGQLLGRLTRAELCLKSNKHWQFCIDFRLCVEAMEALDETSLRRHRLRAALVSVANQWELDVRVTEDNHQSLKALLAERNGSSALSIHAIGHAHIDTAWLWPLRETMRKCARTFSTMCQYLDVYPDFRFSCSQAVQYDWMKENYGALFERIRDRVSRGQWEPVGSMWVEADCNLASGEALLRQILYGKRFFKEEFNVDTRDLWLPDVFGYSASMPQLLRHCGIDFFFTQKISWNQTNRFPHHSFWWQGIDGTRIFSHFTPADTYNGDFSIEQVKRCETAFAQKENASQVMYVYGFGDGGGGPTQEHIERAKRLKDCEGIPCLKMSRVRDFIEAASPETNGLPRWSGELYLELHRGTYTTQARLKQDNRRNEFLLRDVEYLWVLLQTIPVALNATVQRLSKQSMPERAVYDTFAKDIDDAVAARIERAWKLLLLNQFHDIIPGSSIHWVYEDAKRDHLTIRELLEPILKIGLEEIGKRIACGDMRRPAVVLNTLPLDRVERHGQGGSVCAVANGYSLVDLDASDGEGDSSLRFERFGREVVIENRHLKIRVNEGGQIVELYDKTMSRTILKPGEVGNQLTLHHDRPAMWDAWDIDREVEALGEVIESHSERMDVIAESRSVALRFRLVFGQSIFKQTIRLSEDSRRIDFETEVDWRETHRLLRVNFPCAIQTTVARHEIQWGNLERPTHRNTSWDAARFEVCSHKWVDLSEGDYGVALLNDCKYGHSILDSVISLSLLRSPQWPDALADKGTHTFTYALLPHVGDFREAGVIEEAYRLNCPLRVVECPLRSSGELLAMRSLVKVSKSALIMEALKPAEDGNGWIVRLYEAHQTRGEAELVFDVPVKDAWTCNGLEKKIERLKCEGGRIKVCYRPFELITIRVCQLE